MPRPEDRMAEIEKQRGRIRKNHKVNTKKKRQTFQPGEETHLKYIAVILKIAGYTNKQIGASIGVTRGKVGEWLNEPEMQELYQETMEAIPGAAKELLQTYSIEAVHTIAEVMRSDDNKMALEAAKEILDRSGLPRVSKTEAESVTTKRDEVNFSTNPDDLEALRSLPPELQEEAAQAIEGLQEHLKTLAEKAHGSS